MQICIRWKPSLLLPMCLLMRSIESERAELLTMSLVGPATTNTEFQNTIPVIGLRTWNAIRKSQMISSSLMVQHRAMVWNGQD